MHYSRWDGTVKTMFHYRTGRTYHGTDFACPKCELYTIYLVLNTVVVLVVVTVVVRAALVHWTKTVAPEQQTKKNTRPCELYVNKNSSWSSYPYTVISNKLHRQGEITPNYLANLKLRYELVFYIIVQRKSHHALSTEIISPAAAFWAATDAAASASQLAFNAATSWRTSASPGIKCECSIIFSILSAPREVRSWLTYNFNLKFNVNTKSAVTHRGLICVETKWIPMWKTNFLHS